MCRVLVLLSFLMIIDTSATAEEKTYEKRGVLNIKCTCGVYETVKYEWHHIIDVPKDNFTIDLDEVCKKTSNNYDESDILCKNSDDYFGSEYAFDPN